MLTHSENHLSRQFMTLILALTLILGLTGTVATDAAPLPAAAQMTHARQANSGLLANVPEAGDYYLVYEKAIPVSLAASWNSGAVPYDVNNAANVTRPFDRIAYYLELQKSDGTIQWVYVSMDAFTTAVGKIGVPNVASGAFFQQYLANMNVFSNVAGIVTGTGIATGNIEFWPSNWTMTNDKSVPNASPSAYDFGDGGCGTTSGYGSMQIHNYGASQTLFAFNHWGAPTTLDLGIGNSPTAQYADWTFAGNAGAYTARTLQVLVRIPSTVSTQAATDITGVSATLNGTVNPGSLSSTVKFEYGLTTAYGTTVDATPGTVTGLTDTPVSAALTGLTPHVTYHYRVVVTNNMGTIPGGDQVFNASSQLLANVPEASDYYLVYEKAIPASLATSWNSGAVPYDVNNAANVTRPFDRIAYYLELQKSDGTIQWVYVSMDAFTTAVGKIGVPNVASGAFFQRYLANMNVFSNVPGIVTGTGIATGNIEFWPSNWNQNNSNSVPNASSSNFDFGDGGCGTTSGYGSMQIHNYGASQTLFAFNHWGNPATLDVGIGNSPTTQYADWTFAGNAGAYTARTLQVLVRIPSTVSTQAATDITGVSATLNGTVNPGSLSATVKFEYGLTTAYGTTVNATPGTVTGLTDTPVSAALTGLTPNTSYHYRAVITNNMGTIPGGDLTLDTLCLSAPVVVNANDAGTGSLRQALVDVCAGGTIKFGGDYTIALASTLNIDKNMTIDGTGHSVTISGDMNHDSTGETRIFYVNADVIFTLQNLTVTKGYSASNGGGLTNDYGTTTTVNNVTFSDNHAVLRGGAIQNYGTLTITNSMFSDNLADTYGGGILVNSGVVTVTNTTFFNNRADGGQGGGIYTFGALTLTNTTFSNNIATTGSALRIGGSGTLTSVNSIFVKGATGNNCYGGTITGSTNLANDASCGAAVTNSASILLGTPGNYGGATRTIPLQSGSAAIDAGDATTCANAATVNGKDQRGRPRSDWQCDIGAFETQLSDLTAISKSISGIGTYTFGPTLARVEVVSTTGCLTGLQVAWVDGNHLNATPNLQTGHYWTITPTGCSTGFNATLTLPFALAGENSRLCRWLEGNGSGSGWDCDDGTNTTFVANTWVMRSNVPGFSDWAAGDTGPTSVTLWTLSAHSSSSGLGTMVLLAGLVLGVALIRGRRDKAKR